MQSAWQCNYLFDIQLRIAAVVIVRIVTYVIFSTYSHTLNKYRHIMIIIYYDIMNKHILCIMSVFYDMFFNSTFGFMIFWIFSLTFQATVFNNANQHINVYGDNVEVDYRGYEVCICWYYEACQNCSIVHFGDNFNVDYMGYQTLFVDCLEFDKCGYSGVVLFKTLMWTT